VYHLKSIWAQEEESATNLRESLDAILEKIKDAIDQGKTTQERITNVSPDKRDTDGYLN